MRILKMIWQFVIGRTIRSVIFYRISNWCYKTKFLPLSHFFWSLNVALHSIEISPLAKIGSNFRIAHSLGIVIGGQVEIGSNVTIYQNVTLGTKGDPCKGRTYPIIGDNVTLYPGCVVIGGVKIGDNSIVAPNAVVLQDIPPNTLAVGIPAIIKER